MNAYLSIKNLEVKMGGLRDEHTIIRNVSLDVKKGEIVSLMGDSGSGKSTLLRAIAGFEPITAGSITLKGNLIASESVNVPPEKRRIGIMFQDFALFPHLTVEKNIRFGLMHLTRHERNLRVAEMLDLVGLKEMSKRYPHELSGGQQQRVALARSLAPSPDLLLLDEPFSNLDRELRETLALQVRAIIKKTGCTAIMVTHSLKEAYATSDRVGEIRNGVMTEWSQQVPDPSQALEVCE